MWLTRADSFRRELRSYFNQIKGFLGDLDFQSKLADFLILFIGASTHPGERHYLQWLHAGSREVALVATLQPPEPPGLVLLKQNLDQVPVV